MQDTGLIGWPVAHSLSPVIHGYWREKYQVAGSYTLFPIEPGQVAEQIKTVKARGVRGFNVTVPHKQAIIAQLDTVDAVAHHIGAVNTVVRDGSTWRGTNTDAYGFIAHLAQSVGAVKPYLEKAVLLGAGGAARAIVVALKDAGVKQLTILNRTKATADALAAEFGVKAAAWEEKEQALQGATLLVNSTSLGMTGKPPLEIDLGPMAADAAVYDIVYAPLQTDLLRQTSATGRRPVDGLGMLVFQAQKAFEEWHGVLPEVDEALRQRLREALQKRSAT